MKNFGAVKTNRSKILANAIDAIYDAATGNRGYYNAFEAETLANLCDIPYDKEKREFDREAFTELRNTKPERTLLLMTYWLMDRSSKSYVSHDWDSTEQIYKSHYKDNQSLDQVYYFLEELGYECSDEERQMRRGIHPLFDKEEE